ncbi:hypothetical protein KY328_05630, partial [Candidatus Woesearchaeota archaeon]|nr:hypothetical protein [Candidatus Woesearchaeota archaeon]
DLLKHMTPVYDGVPACLMAFLANAHTSMQRDAIVGPYEFMKDCRDLLEDVLGPNFRIDERFIPVNEGLPHELSMLNTITRAMNSLGLGRRELVLAKCEDTPARTLIEPTLHDPRIQKYNHLDSFNLREALWPTPESIDALERIGCNRAELEDYVQRYFKDGKVEEFIPRNYHHWTYVDTEANWITTLYNMFLAPIFGPTDAQRERSTYLQGKEDNWRSASRKTDKVIWRFYEARKGGGVTPAFIYKLFKEDLDSDTKKLFKGTRRAAMFARRLWRVAKGVYTLAQGFGALPIYQNRHRMKSFGKNHLIKNIPQSTAAKIIQILYGTNTAFTVNHFYTGMLDCDAWADVYSYKNFFESVYRDGGIEALREVYAFADPLVELAKRMPELHAKYPFLKHHKEITNQLMREFHEGLKAYIHTDEFLYGNNGLVPALRDTLEYNPPAHVRERVEETLRKVEQDKSKFQKELCDRIDEVVMPEMYDADGNTILKGADPRRIHWHKAYTLDTLNSLPEEYKKEIIRATL